MTPRSLLTPLWSLRILWLAMPLLAGPAIADALADRSRSVQLAVSAVAWVAWAATLVALGIPRSLTLTLVRVLVPGAGALTLWSALGADRPAWAAVAVVAALVATAASLTASVADTFVDGSSYGAERRVALRAPAALAVAAALAWTALAAAVTLPVVALASARWMLGVIGVVVGLGTVVVLGVRLHQLSRRWLVFVPAGLVVHDPLTLAEPVLLQRHLLARVGPASADAADHAVDLTGGALGLAVQVTMREPFAIGRREGRDTVEVSGVTALLVTPGRPAVTLELAREHRLPVA